MEFCRREALHHRFLRGLVQSLKGRRTDPGESGRGIRRKSRHLQGRHGEGAGTCLDVQHPQHPVDSFCAQGWKTSDVHGSFAQRKFRPGDQGCSPSSRADRFLSGTWDEFKSVGGSNRIIGETSGFSRTGRIALQPDPLPEQCSEKMCTARRDGMQAFEPFGRRTGSGKDE